MRRMTLPLALYIHMPWCVQKCPYCDFNSHALRGEMQEQEYLQALLANFDSLLIHIQDREIYSIFIGGGTPSLFSAAAYEYLFAQLKQRVKFANNIEITLEANPGTVDEQHFYGYRAAGINRLSIGAQSFQNDKLKKLGRIHETDNIYRAVEIAKKSGFDNFNLDLMFGLPQQSIEDALFDLQSAMDLKPTHLSWYQLTLEPNTFFYKHPPKLPNEDYLWEMQEAGQKSIAANRYQQYEISAYSLADRQCIHNLNYWQFGDYLGIGAGAHSKITNLKTGEIQRFANVKSPKLFMSGPLFLDKNETRILKNEELGFEFMLNALRLTQAIPKKLFIERTHGALNLLEKPLGKARNLNLLIEENEHWQVTEKGQRYLNELLELFL